MKRRVGALVGLATLLVATLAGTALGGARQSGERVTITMREFRFNHASRLPRGSVRVTFRNRGDFPHNFTIVARSQGATQFRSTTLDGGQSQTRSLNLRPGVYVAVCTVNNGGHIARGMVTRFRVGRFNEDNGTWR
jgi:plastocyanin